MRLFLISEAELSGAVAELKSAVNAGDNDNAKFFCNKASMLLSGRNNRCKALK